MKFEFKGTLSEDIREFTVMSSFHIMCCDFKTEWEFVWKLRKRADL